MIESDVLHYSDGETDFYGTLIFDTATEGPAPGVLIAPAFFGTGPLEIARGQDLAALGYTVLCLDIYGEGKRAADREEAARLMGALNADRPRLARHMQAALDALASRPRVDPGRIGAIGYCFGGKCVLDLARSGAPIRAAVPIHGIYDRPQGMAPQKMQASVLVLHGWDDPLAPPEAVVGLGHELTELCPDWQILAFGHAAHAFTNPEANAPENGLAYNETADRRAWAAMTDFLAETLGPAGTAEA